MFSYQSTALVAPEWSYLPVSSLGDTATLKSLETKTRRSKVLFPAREHSAVERTFSPHGVDRMNRIVDRRMNPIVDRMNTLERPGYLRRDCVSETSWPTTRRGPSLTSEGHFGI